MNILQFKRNLYLSCQVIPIKCFVSHRPTDPLFSKSKKKKKHKTKIPDSLVKEASTLIYKHTMLFYNNNWFDVMSLSLINIDTTFLKTVETFDSRKDHVFELTLQPSFLTQQPGLLWNPDPFVFIFFFLPDRPTHQHKRRGDGKRNILL